MIGDLQVATLVAPTGGALSDADIATTAQRIIAKGGSILQTKRIDIRAADIFYEPSVPRHSREGGNPAPSVCEAYDSSYNDFPFDIITQPTANRRKKILIADMESTIIEQEMLDEMGEMLGVGAQVAEVTRRAMNGELDFGGGLRERVKLLRNQPETLLRDVATRMTLMAGAQPLIESMKRAGAKTWLVSGGFIYFIKIIAEQLGFDRYFGNDLIIENGLITGAVALPTLGKDTKKQLLEQACATYGCTLADTLTIGDGANDIPMLETCAAGGGLGVAFRAKPNVRKLIHSQINHSDLSALIYAQNLFPP